MARASIKVLGEALSGENPESPLDNSSTFLHSSSTCEILDKAGGIACHCLLNQLATSACGPDSQGSRRMLNHLRDPPADSGTGSWISHVVSAFTTPQSVESCVEIKWLTHGDG